MKRGPKVGANLTEKSVMAAAKLLLSRNDLTFG